MTQAAQTASTDAREASMSRVTTQDALLSKLAAPGAASVPATGETAAEPVKEGEGEPKPKKPFNERIQELVAKRKDAESQAAAEKRRADELEARLQALAASARPLEADARPVRSAFTTDDDYIDAVADWKARRAIAERERQQAQARAEAEQAEIAGQWSKRQEQAMKELPDYADVVGKSEVNVPAHIHQALLESDQGPQLAYFLALHPEEAKQLAQMKPLAAIKRIAALERDLGEIAQDTPAAEPPAKPQKSKAPEPIAPVKSVPSSSSSASGSYEEYKRRRQAEQKR